MKTILIFIVTVIVSLGAGFLFGLNAANIGLDTPYAKELFANNLHNFIDLAKAILWPLAVVLGICLFQDDLKRIVDAFATRATKFEGFGIAIALHGDHDTSNMTSLTIKQDAIANIYWLGADIMFTVGCLQEGLAKRFVLHGLQQAIHHAEAVFNSDNIIAVRLKGRHQEIIHFSEPITAKDRQRIAEDLVALRNQIGSAIETKQDGYKNGLENNTHLSPSDRVKRLKQ